MRRSGRFDAGILAELDRAKIVGVRAGDSHRFTGVWVVVVAGRAFVRSWNDSPTGWCEAFRHEPIGALQLGSRLIPTRAVQVRSQRTRDAVTEAYARKYDTKASLKWVTGFARPERARATVELVPAATD